ncbi:MAG TPA: hypothetical protein VKQ73_01365 [Stellaceae bacterium]|nr:hypothetical protein [Stellaceae bacterium]
MTTRLAHCAALGMAALLIAGSVAAATRHPARSLNPANDRLVRMAPAARAAELAQAVGHWCIGTETFLMGVSDSGRGAGNAYWSLRCADGSTWAIQIDPLAEVTAIDCDTFNAQGAGKECFKKF